MVSLSERAIAFKAGFYQVGKVEAGPLDLFSQALGSFFSREDAWDGFGERAFAGFAEVAMFFDFEGDEFISEGAVADPNESGVVDGTGGCSATWTHRTQILFKELPEVLVVRQFRNSTKF